MIKRQCRRMFIQLCIHWLWRWRAAAVLLCPAPVPVPLDDDVSSPPRKHTGGMVHPPLGVLAWVGGWHGVAHAWDSYIYLILYTFIHIATLIN